MSFLVVFCLTNTLISAPPPYDPPKLLLFQPGPLITCVFLVASVPTTVCSLTACKGKQVILGLLDGCGRGTGGAEQETR